MIQTQHQKKNMFRLGAGGTPNRDQILDVKHNGHLLGVTTGERKGEGKLGKSLGAMLKGFFGHDINFALFTE
jgi:hypothetical protein